MILRKPRRREKAKSMIRDKEFNDDMVHGKYFWIWYINQDDETQQIALRDDIEAVGSFEICVPCGFDILKEIEKNG